VSRRKQKQNKTRREALAVAGLFLALTLALAAPLLSRFFTALPHDAIDPLFNTWLLWWNAARVPLTKTWWNAPAFFPAEGVTAFSEHLLGLGPVATPVLWVTGSPIAAYNVAWLVSFPLCGLAAYGLARHLTARSDAALLAGLAFAFAPYRAAQLAHLQVLSAYWMPVALLALHRYREQRRARWLLVFGGAYWLQALTNGYYLLYFPVLVLLWLAWFATERGTWSVAAAVAGSQLAAGLLVLPLLLGYQQIHGRYGFARSADEIARFSADLAALLQAPDTLVAWRWIGVVIRPEGELFPGATIPIVILVGAVVGWMRSPAPRDLGRGRWIRRLAALGATVLAAGVAVRLLVGPWSVPLAGHRVISLTRLPAPLGYLAVCLLVWAALTPKTRAIVARRSVFAFYVLAAIVLWVLALGPAARWFGEPVLAPLPYAWLQRLPGFGSGLRVPARFWMLAVLCLSTAVGLAFARFAPRRPAYRASAAALIAGGLLVDGWFTLAVAEAPTPSCAETAISRPDVTNASGVVAVLYLPLGRPADDVAAMYRAAWRGVPSVNGMSGFFPPHYGALAWALEHEDVSVLDLLARRGPLAVVIDDRVDEARRWRRFLARHPRARLLAWCGGTAVYRVDAATTQAAPALERLRGRRLSMAAVRANVNGERVGFAIDGDLQSRWETGPQQPDQWIEVDLGAPVHPRAVLLWLGPFALDFPRVLLAESSVDAHRWTEEWRGSTSALALEGALADPRGMPLVVPLAGRAARYLRLRQIGRDPVFYWSVAELAVVGTP
jgi:hypothetical protein